MSKLSKHIPKPPIHHVGSSLHVDKEIPHKKNSDEETQNSKDAESTNNKAIPLHKLFSLKQAIIAIIIGVVLLAIIFGTGYYFAKNGGAKTLAQLHEANYKSKATENSFVYNGFSFVRVRDSMTIRDTWYTQYYYQGSLFDIPMRYSPLDVQNVSFVLVNKTENKTYKRMYITITPTEDNTSRQYAALAVSELSQKLSMIKQYPLEAACTINRTEACTNRPVIDCTNAENSVVVYIDDKSPDTRILIDGNCFVIQGADESLVKATDALIYRLLEITK